MLGQKFNKGAFVPKVYPKFTAARKGPYGTIWADHYVECSGGQSIIQTDVGMKPNTGRWFFEAHLTVTPAFIGFAADNISLTAALGAAYEAAFSYGAAAPVDTQGTWNVVGSTTIVTNGGAGDDIGIVYDTNTGATWVYKNGVLVNSGVTISGYVLYPSFGNYSTYTATATFSFGKPGGYPFSYPGIASVHGANLGVWAT